jgi:hypothetical protein
MLALLFLCSSGSGWEEEGAADRHARSARHAQTSALSSDSRSITGTLFKESLPKNHPIEHPIGVFTCTSSSPRCISILISPSVVSWFCWRSKLFCLAVLGVYFLHGIMGLGHSFQNCRS